LFYFTLLLFPYFYHNLFDAGIHFLSKLILADWLSIDPSMLHYCIEGDSLFWVRVEHFLNKI
jgi:hypothetical protein